MVSTLGNYFLKHLHLVMVKTFQVPSSSTVFNREIYSTLTLAMVILYSGTPELIPINHSLSLPSPFLLSCHYAFF